MGSRGGPGEEIEQSLAANPNNVHGAHGFAHVCYESGELDAARTLPIHVAHRLSARRLFYGHLSWHLSLCEIQAGEWAEASGLCRDAIALDRQQRRVATVNFRGAALLCGVLNSLAILATRRPGKTLEPLRTHGLIEDRAALRERVPPELLAQSAPGFGGRWG